MNNYIIFNVGGLSHTQVDCAVIAAQAVVDPEIIREMWMMPGLNRIYVSVALAPCVEVPHDFGDTHGLTVTDDFALVRSGRHGRSSCQ